MRSIEQFISTVTAGWQDSKGLRMSPRAQAVSYPEERRAECFEVEDQSFWFEHRRRAMDAVMERYKPAGIFLDVGGGNGFVTRWLCDKGVQAILVEPGQSGCRFAIERGVTDVLCGTLEDLSFEVKKPGAVGLFDVIEHLPDDRAFLESAAAALQPGGRIYITVPALPFLWSSADRDAGHYRRYTRASLENALNSAGFKPLYVSYFFAGLTAPLFLIRTLLFCLRRKNDNARDKVSRKQHLSSMPFLRHVALAFFAWEIFMLRHARLPLGTSLIAVAEK